MEGVTSPDSYVLHARHRLEQFGTAPPADSYPEPCAHCAQCHWQERCTRQWEEDDHLSRVANMQRAQTDRLRREGITTLTALAGTPADARIADLNPAVFERLRAQ